MLHRTARDRSDRTQPTVYNVCNVIIVLNNTDNMLEINGNEVNIV